MEQGNTTVKFLGIETTWLDARITLDDIQPLWGGRQIVVTGSGKATIRIVEHGAVEQRYELTLNRVDLERVFAAVVENDLLTITPAERPGLPDEARPRVTLTNAGGETRSVEKWAGVRDERLDMITVALVQLEALTLGMDPDYSGPYSGSTL